VSADTRSLTRELWTSIGGDSSAVAALTFTGTGKLTASYAVTAMAGASVAVAALSVAELAQHLSGGFPAVSVDLRLTSFWFGTSIRPIGWQMPPLWDAVAGDYRASDGWIRLHTNAPHHRTAVERVLGHHASKNEMAHTVAQWEKQDLETAIVEAGGCAAEMRSTVEWAEHPQGRAVAAEPLVHIRTGNRALLTNGLAPISRPLDGIRVLDLTRVLAGPVASRFLAGYGAEVLRIDPPDWNEPNVVPDVTLGKRCARLNLKSDQSRVLFEALLSEAHVFLHNYRSDALDRLGYDAEVRRALAPGLVDVGLCAYGWSGPWARRRGFDSLVQMSTGIADTGMRQKHADQPVPLPVQALDHTTGYLAAATAIRGITQRMLQGVGTEARLSLARTAKLLVDQHLDEPSLSLASESEADLSPAIEKTDWGEARRLIPPVSIDRTQMWWSFPASNLGTSSPSWTTSIKSSGDACS
jgi:crotonobetainyl-CoA:carnitine CoA-transferase CaiB-like acyl-CoA transferase